MGTEHASALTYAVHGALRDASEWVGRHIESDAPFPVEAGRIADFCSLVEDPNPRYWQSGPGRLAAPPGTLMVWRLPPPWHPDGRPEHGFLFGMEIPLAADSVINASTDMWFTGPMLVGDRLRYRERITEVSEEKRTALGVGWFITTETTVTTTDGRSVGGYRNVLLRFSPEHDASPVIRSHARPSMPTSEFAEIRFPVTAATCALVPAGTRDGFPGHHDGEAARAQGIPDRYPNTMFFHGLVDRAALEWIGFDGWIARRNLVMHRPAEVGQVLRIGGRVTARRVADKGDEAVELEVSVHTEAGGAIVSSAITVFPAGPPTGT